MEARSWTFGLRDAKLKNGVRLFGLAALGLLLLLVGPMFMGRDGEGGKVEAPVEPAPAGTESSEFSLADLERDLAAEAASVLSSVDGAGRVVVSVRLKMGPGYSYADNRNMSQRRTEERDTSGGTRTITETNESVQAVMARRPQGGEEAPIITGIQRAQVDGVVVVAEGATDSRVREDIFQAVEIMLGVPAHRITVLPMKVGE